jgi:mono/diheme cytochrome c family protein
MNLLRLLCLLSPAALVATGGSLQAGTPDFSREILPILSENCFHCHGQDGKARKADLRLDREEEAKKYVDGHAAIVPGKSDLSAIIERMRSSDPDEVMPPPDSNRRISPEDLEKIAQWIDGGAKWGEHWAFTRIEKPAVPPLEPGMGNEVDAFVRRKLSEKGIAPSGEAPPETLIRRLSLDLTGLPPEPDATKKFVEEYQSASHPDEVYGRLVDRLLASPRYGERWAWDWLDAARYADTNGYQGDNTRTAWPWRDWVVRAINENLPYDQFTTWQIAGDLLPEATTDQKLATAFVRNHMINGEGGRIAEENRIEYLFDQAETVGTVWLGLTMQCTRCHDHKFDPLTMNDYYSLVAFFNNTSVTGQGGSGQTAPVLDMSTPEEAERSRTTQAKVFEVAKTVEAFEWEKFPRPEGKGLEESDAIKLPGNLPSYIAKTVPEKRGVDPLLESINYFKERDAEYAAVLQSLMDAVRQRDAARNNITRVMVMEDRKEAPRDTFILNKGAYDSPSETKVGAAIPAKFGTMPAEVPPNRLGLAQWIVSRENPLTARVTVNRYWQSLFGIGLVKTAEDFGFQGERPVHMDLLDFLAADFMESGWDVKALLKKIVMSATYRQSSRITTGDLDPENRLLARGARFRLPSHTLRDQALLVSGLLVEKPGGPAVNPYQPEGIWEEATFGKIKYTQDSGDALYRPSLYTFWRRIVGPTMVFDNATRQTCSVKTSRTNTPLHALTTMNETGFVESARGFAERLLANAELKSDSDRFDHAGELVLARIPTPEEKETLSTTLTRLRNQYSATPEEAAKLISIGESKRSGKLDAVEHAAWTGLCLMILNLDEALTKE